MTVQEIIRIKRLLEGNFLKVKEMDDKVFVAAFNEFDFGLMQIACMQYIKKNKFQPTIANIIDEYDQVLKSQKTEIVKLMNSRGWFHHSTEYEKALSWVVRDIIPEWFKNMMIEFINQNKQLKTQNIKLLIVMKKTGGSDE